ncbi:hypothetical protein KIP88_39335 [Bradyrhizobium sp. SRL28]|nr:hypothetical protein [Bradyrhizobium sp. SRL28]MBT1516490.1 hypothetical protein [Bradyrhizobium sp. SRL28]
MAGSQGKVAIVNCSGAGVGKPAGLALLANGWKMAIAGRRKEPLEHDA